MTPTRVRGIKKWGLAILLAAGTLASLLGPGLWKLLSSDAESGGAGQWVTLDGQPSERQIVTKGIVVPARSVDVVSPTEGVVANISVGWGDVVQQGQVLLQINSKELEMSLQEAQATYLRGQADFETLRDKNASPEYAAIVRRHQSARQALALAEARLLEAESLHTKGIIAKQELQQTELEVANNREQLQAASDELRAAERKWSPEGVRIAAIEQKIRQARYEDLVERKRKTLIHAPIGGVVLQPTAETEKGGAGAREVRAGSGVTARDVLMTIADTSALMVHATVRQEELSGLRPGAKALIKVASDGMVQVPATVHRVAGQPRQFNPSNVTAMLQNSQPAEFDVQLLVQAPVPGTGRQGEEISRLRLGTQVVVSVTVAESASAIAIPVSAVQWDAQGNPVVRYRPEAANGLGELIPVQVVKTTMNEAFVARLPAHQGQVWVPASNGLEAQVISHR